MKVLILLLTGLKAVPFLVTQLLFCSARMDSEKARLRKVRIPGTLLNLALNGAACYGVTALLLGRLNLLPVPGRLLRGAGSYTELSAMAVSLLACTVLACLLGAGLRALFFRKESGGISRGRTGAALLLSLVCAAAAFAGIAAEWKSADSLVITEVCRKTDPAFLTEEEKAGLEAGAGDVSWVTVMNPGPLSCEAPVLRLSGSEDEPEGIPFERQVIPAGGTLRLVMNEAHGLDLSRRKEGTVLLTGEGGRLIDRVRVPALEEYESWARKADGSWELRWQGKPMDRDGSLPVPAFSAAGGFYEAGFELALSAPAGLEIHYTLDGSDPLASSPVYTGPIRIDDRSGEANTWSMRTDVCAAFRLSPDSYRVPSAPVDKCTVVRAVCTDAEGHTGPAAAASYFIGFGDKAGYGNTGTISLVTDPDNLFSEDRGIYVLGKSLADWLKDDPAREGLQWWQWFGNFRQSWERDAVITVFDGDGQEILHKEIGIQVKGGGSPSYLPKGLNLYARKCYDGTDTFEGDPAGAGFATGRLSLFAGGQEIRTKVKDWLTARLTEGLGMNMLTFDRVYALFLDGEYWGNYWLTETLDADFLRFRTGCSPENAVLIKNGAVKEGTGQDLEGYREMFRFIAEGDMTDEAEFAKACGMIDPENYLTYMAVETYLVNGDWGPERNCALWRAREPEDGGSLDGRWRWLLFDLNDARCYTTREGNTVDEAQEKDAMFRSLMRNGGFRRAFYERLEMLADEVFTPARGKALIKEYRARMLGALDLEHRRFHDEAFNRDRLKWIENFFAKRQEEIRAMCEERLAH